MIEKWRLDAKGIKHYDLLKLICELPNLIADLSCEDTQRKPTKEHSLSLNIPLTRSMRPLLVPQPRVTQHCPTGVCTYNIDRDTPTPQYFVNVLFCIL